MKASTQPPSGPTWLLNRFGLGNDALTGDLFEDYSQGRSAAWYWKQVLIAIVVDFGKEVRAHKLLALRALVVGWIALDVLLRWVENPWWRFAGRVLLPRGLIPSPYWWHHYYLYPALLIPCIFAGASGWIVGRCHRAHREAMVVVYLLSVQLWLFCQGGGFRLVEDVLGNRRFLPYLLSWVANFIFITIAILLGGLWGDSRERAMPSTPSATEPPRDAEHDVT
jgi:hypothetical protein